MAASIRFSLPIFLLSAAICSVGETSQCSRSYDYVNGSCISISVNSLHPQGKPEWKLEKAEEECRRGDKYPLEWRLPKLDSQEKMDALAVIVFNATKTTENSFWIGLRREKEETSMDGKVWRDWSKFQWTSDNSSLKMDNSTYPTWPWKDADPDGSRWGQFCVFANVGNIGLKWNVKHCDRFEVMYVVCESVDVSTTTTTTTTMTTSTPTTPTTSMTPTATTTSISRHLIKEETSTTVRKGKLALSPWIWVGVVAFALIIGAVPGIVIFVRRRRQQKKKQMQEAEDSTTMVSAESAMSSNSANVRSQEKKGGRNDSISERTASSLMFSSRRPSTKKQKS